jgi:hypothetical protein
MSKGSREKVYGIWCIILVVIGCLAQVHDGHSTSKLVAAVLLAIIVVAVEVTYRRGSKASPEDQ